MAISDGVGLLSNEKPGCLICEAVQIVSSSIILLLEIKAEEINNGLLISF